MRIPAQMGFLSRKQKTVEPPSPTELVEPYADEPVEEFDVQIPTHREEVAGSPTPPEPDDVEIVVSHESNGAVPVVSEPERAASPSRRARRAGQDAPRGPDRPQPPPDGGRGGGAGAGAHP